MNKISTWTSAIALGVIGGVAAAPMATAQGSGFLDDYSKLQDTDDVYLDQMYIAPGALDRLKGYTGVMVDQPEIFVSAESPYKGTNPDAMKALADALRQGMTDRVATKFNVAQGPGRGVLYLHWAITDLYIQKKKKKFYQFTPAGLVVSGAMAAVIQDIWKKVDIVEMTIEAELVDSQSDEVLGAMLVKEGARKDKKAGQKKRDPVTWEEIDAMMQTFGSRLTCHMGNARLPEAQRADCRAIVMQAGTKK